MLLGAGIDVDIAACASRREGARALCALGCDALILDDGFTHRAIARDIDIVVLRDGAPKGSNHLLPWGTLREPTSSLGRADVVWHHCRGKESSPAEARAECAEPRPARSGLLRVESVQRPGVTTDANGAEVSLVGKNIVGACGIGHPQDFFGAILAAGARPTSKVTFGDHHDFTQADVARLVREAERSEATVVVTPKDWAKLAAMREAAGFLVLGIEIELTTGSEGLAERLGWPLPRRFALGAGLAQGRYE
jgi:tetraacyldisaccharide 4'-kinase